MKLSASSVAFLLASGISRCTAFIPASLGTPRTSNFPISAVPTGFSVQEENAKPIVVGASVAGIASAIVLKNAGLDAILLEECSRDALTEGAGTNLQAKAIVALNSLGVSTSTLIEAGAVITKQSYYCPDGRHVGTLDKSGDGTTPGQIAIDEGKLSDLLLETAASKDIEVLMNHHVSAIRQKSSSGTVGVKAKDTLTDDLLVLDGSMVLGADGINSKIRREHVSGSEKRDHRHYHGMTIYRGVVENFPSFLDGETMIIAGGVGVKAVVYPIGTPCEKGLQTINWEIAVDEQDENTDPSTQKGHLIDLLSTNGFNLDFLDLKSMITETPSIRAFPMVDLDPLEKWTNGRICLTGEAAHGMLPVGSGETMAGLFDALALKEALEESKSDPTCDALKTFEKLRFKDASLHQSRCRVQPAEHIVQEVLDTIPGTSEVPLEYEQRLREVMKLVQDPPNHSVASYVPSTLAQKMLLRPKAAGMVTAPTVTKAGGDLIDQLTLSQRLTPLERVALTCAGNLQMVFSSFYLQPVEVSVDRFELALTDEDGNASKSPLAVYDREVCMDIAGQQFCKATSKVRIYDAELDETLTTQQVGIGQLLRMRNLAPKFRLHDAGRNKHGGMWRFYSMDCKGIVDFDIVEEFSGDAWDMKQMTSVISSEEHPTL
mmetsp:Transcript_30859/g.57167  ORF Transcript_30859/g.57167 Transcript_30859/m.57167 type:complete len:659 (-) Transcript_30859:162-2138(-)